jgi:hypothetical protein
MKNSVLYSKIEQNQELTLNPKRTNIENSFPINAKVHKTNPHANSYNAGSLAFCTQPSQNPECAYVFIQNRTILRNKAFSLINNQFTVVFHVLQSIQNLQRTSTYILK